VGRLQTERRRRMTANPTDGPHRWVRRIDPDDYPILHRGQPHLHENLAWYATTNDIVVGVVVRDRVDDDFSWVAVLNSGSGFVTEDLGHSLPTEEAATKALCASMARLRGEANVF